MFLQGNLPVERTIKTSYHPGSPDGKENKTQTTSAREARQILTNELIFFLFVSSSTPHIVYQKFPYGQSI